MGCIGIIAILAAILVPNFIRARQHGQYTACRSNLTNISTALAMFATDHAGNYPTDLAELAPEYLTTLPACPNAPADSPTYSQTYKLGPGPHDFSCACQATNHPRYGAPKVTQRGLEVGAPVKAIPGLFEKTMAVGFALFCCFGFCVGIVWQPGPIPQAESVMIKHPWLAKLSRACWGLLCALAMAGAWFALPHASDDNWVDGLDRFSFATLIGAAAGQLLVRAGWALWRRLSPPEPYSYSDDELEVEETPGLMARASAPVLRTAGECRKARWLTLGLPLATLFVCCTGPALGREPTDALKASLLGAAVGVILLFPAYLWAKRWASDLFDRRLEWIPGSGVLLEHSHPWGQQIQRRLGTAAEIEQWESLPNGVYSFRLAGNTYQVASGELSEILKGSIPPDES